LTQGESDLVFLEAGHLGAGGGVFRGQIAIVLPVMVLIMPRPVSAKGNFVPCFYEE
jgi:hypothetical protein